MISRALLAASRNQSLKAALLRLPLTRRVVSRYVGGETVDEAIAATRQLTSSGLQVSVDHLGEDVTERAQVTRTTATYLDLLDRMRQLDLGAQAEVSVKLSAVGQFLGPDGTKLALEQAQRICAAAAAADTTVTLDAEDHTTIDSTYEILTELRRDFPQTGAVVQAYLYRSQGDCRDLARAGSRVRLCKGAYDEPASVAFRAAHDVDMAFVRCLKILVSGPGYPMIASHDPTMIDIARQVATDAGRNQKNFEFQMLHGVRAAEQLRLAQAGYQVRVYLPFGEDWYGYLVRRMAERPANLALFLRSLLGR